MIHLNQPYTLCIPPFILLYGHLLIDAGYDVLASMRKDHAILDSLTLTLLIA